MDKQLESKLGNLTSPVPSGMFERIMDARDRKKRFAWWRTMSIVLGGGIVISVLSYFWLQNPADNATKNQALNAQKSEAQAYFPNEAKSSTPIVHLEEKKSSQLNRITKKETNTYRNSPPEVMTILDNRSAPTPMVHKSSEKEAEPNAFAVNSGYSLLKENRPAYIQPQDMSIKYNLPFVAPSFELPDECYSFGRRQRGNARFFVDVLGSPDYVSHTISTSDREYDDYVDIRNETEKFNSAYSAQVGLGVITGVGIVLRSGVNYSQINQTFNRVDPGHRKLVIEQIFDSQGNLIGLDTAITYGKIEVQHANTHKTFGIPVTIGYTTDGNKLDVGVNVGVQININQVSEGRFNGTDLMIADYTIDSGSLEPAFATNIGAQAIGNLTLAYELGDKLDLILAPHLKYTTKSVTSAKYPLSQKHLTAGMWLGLRIGF